MFPFPASEEVAGFRKGRHPSTVKEARVPTDVIDMQMRAQHIVDVLGRKTGGGQISKIRPVLLMIARLVRALFVVARAGVYQDRGAWCLDDRTVERED